MRVCFISLVLGLLSSGCSASEPASGPGTFPPLGSGPYAHIAFGTCKPTAACPGPTSAQNAVGQEDGLGVDMCVCTTLDVAWNGGIGKTRLSPTPDLAVYLQRVEGIVRVEVSGSAESKGYQLVGFIGGTQQTKPGEPTKNCTVEIQGNKALVDFSKCSTDYVANVNLVRLTLVGDGTKAPIVDAVELLHYSPLGQP
jgi:hypothetical protein